jgi:hypothetical protein
MSFGSKLRIFFGILIHQELIGRRKNNVMKLYKYLSDRTFRDHLQSHLNGEVHFSAWREFNDPMEGFFVYIANKDPRHQIDAIIGEKAVYRVSCFCRSWKKFLLWSYYTNKHRGVCLEFEVNKRNLPANCSLAPINYASTLPQFDSSLSADEQAKKFLLTKMRPWNQEGEWRLLGRNLQQYTVPFGRLTGIIFGANYADGDPNDTTRQQVVHETRSMGIRPPVLYQAYIEGNTPEIRRRVFDRCDQNRI